MGDCLFLLRLQTVELTSASPVIWTPADPSLYILGHIIQISVVVVPQLILGVILYSVRLLPTFYSIVSLTGFKSLTISGEFSIF